MSYLSAAWVELERALALVRHALLDAPAALAKASGSDRGYAVVLANGPTSVGCAWVAGDAPVALAAIDAPGAPPATSSPLGQALRLAVANYAVGAVVVVLLWDSAGRTAQLVIAPLPTAGPPGPAIYCSRCGALASSGELCRLCGGQFLLRVVEGVPVAA